MEDEVRAGLEKLNLQPRSSSGSQSPRAGPHSKLAKVQRTKGGAKDVWHFYEKTGPERVCILCK